MQRAAFIQAKRRFNSAMKALDRLVNATDLGSFEEAWSDFIVAAHGVYLKLEIGAKGHPKSEPWFGRKVRERKKDPLLRYIHAARNTDTHGLEHGIAYRTTTEFKSVAPTPVMVDGKRAWRVEISPEKITAQSTEAILTPVTDTLHKDTFDPPTMHLGQPINDPDPIRIAGLASVYLLNLLNEAEGRVA